MNSLESPKPIVVRSRIEAVQHKEMRMFLMADFAFCARSVELCGLPEKGEQSYGPRGNEVELEDWQDEDYPDIRAKIAVFTIRTAKRDGFVRKIGLPLDYEPWAGILADYWKEFGKELVFYFPRSKPKYYVESRGVFSGIQYPILPYYVEGEGEKREQHMRELVLHGLRHVRANELMERYNFNLEQVATYGGWTLRSQGREISPALTNSYLLLGYRHYIKKLLKK